MQKIHEEIRNQGYEVYKQETILDKKEFHNIMKDLESKAMSREITSFVILPGAGIGEKNEKTFFAEGTYTFYVKKP